MSTTGRLPEWAEKATASPVTESGLERLARIQGVIIEVLLEALELHARKNHDYTGNAKINPFDLGLKGRFHDLNRKFSRIYHIMWENREIKVDEKLEDTAMDLGNYSFLLVEDLKNYKNNRKNSIWKKLMRRI